MKNKNKTGAYENEDICTGMDIPSEPWTPEDIKYWTGSERYQPWKDVADFFRNSAVHV